MTVEFDQLMQAAKQIKDKAVEVEGLKQARLNAQAAGPHGMPNPVDHDRIEQKYAFIEPLFEPFAGMPDPAGFDDLLEGLHKAMARLSTGEQNHDPIGDLSLIANDQLNRVSTAGENLVNWTGMAAGEFKRKFCDTFGSVAANQFLVLGIMRGALQMHQDMWRKAREDICEIAQSTQDALDNADCSGKNDWEFAFSVLSAIGAVAAVPFSGGTSLMVASVSAAGAAGSAATNVPMNGSGDSAEAITNWMKNAINKLTEHIQNTEKEIANNVDKATEVVTSSKDSFVAARPALAGMEGGELTGRDGLGRAG